MPAKGGVKNRDFSPPLKVPSVEDPRANHPLFAKAFTQVTSKKFFIELCDPYRKFCKYLKFQNRNSATNEIYFWIIYSNKCMNSSKNNFLILRFRKVNFVCGAASIKLFRRFVFKRILALERWLSKFLYILTSYCNN